MNVSTKSRFENLLQSKQHSNDRELTEPECDREWARRGRRSRSVGRPEEEGEEEVVLIIAMIMRIMMIMMITMIMMMTMIMMIKRMILIMV